MPILNARLLVKRTHYLPIVEMLAFSYQLDNHFQVDFQEDGYACPVRWLGGSLVLVVLT